MRSLFLGDVVGRTGRDAVTARLGAWPAVLLPVDYTADC